MIRFRFELNRITMGTVWTAFPFEFFDQIRARKDTHTWRVKENRIVFIRASYLIWFDLIWFNWICIRDFCVNLKGLVCVFVWRVCDINLLGKWIHLNEYHFKVYVISWERLYSANEENRTILFDFIRFYFVVFAQQTKCKCGFFG